jgi:transketolase C-terminal domain/subunit
MEKPSRQDCSQGLAQYVRTYSLFRSGRLSTNIKLKLTLCKALIRSVMTHACPTREYAAGAHLLKLQRLQNSTPRYWKP